MRPLLAVVLLACLLVAGCPAARNSTGGLQGRLLAAQVAQAERANLPSEIGVAGAEWQAAQYAEMQQQTALLRQIEANTRRTP